jgi:hypothetical protein
MINVVAEHTLVLSVASKRIVTPCMMILSTRPTSSTSGLTEAASEKTLHLLHRRLNVVLRSGPVSYEFHVMLARRRLIRSRVEACLSAC